MTETSFASEWEDAQKIEQAVEAYTWQSAADQFQWAEEAGLRQVRAYLRWADHIGYWRIIVQGGVRGYSLFLHELIELNSFKRRDLNPLDYDQQTKYYRHMHAHALIAEHRFLQTIAQISSYSFSLRELIVYNPHGDEPDDEWEGDWEVLIKHLPHVLNPADQRLDSACESDVRQFYQRLGFRRGDNA